MRNNLFKFDDTKCYKCKICKKENNLLKLIFKRLDYRTLLEEVRQDEFEIDNIKIQE